MENKVQNFYELEAWKTGHDLVLEVYKVTGNFPREEQFGMTSQLRRAASSITANIAEGFERYHFNDKQRFYHMARGSAGEVQNFFLLAKDLDFITIEACNSINEKIIRTRKLINGLIRSIENQK